MINSATELEADPLLTNEQAAKLAGITAHTMNVWRMTGRHSIKYIRYGRTIRYRRSEIEKFVSRHEVSAGTDEN
jgi:excisionase family DNA binding protein